MTTSELFEIVTFSRDWWKGYTTSSYARVIKHRHYAGKLGFEAYADLFAHFGYTQTDNWHKIEKLK